MHFTVLIALRTRRLDVGTDLGKCAEWTDLGPRSFVIIKDGKWW